MTPSMPYAANRGSRAAFPMPYTVDLSLRMDEGGFDELGDPIEQYADWVTGLPVYGWSPPDSSEPKLAGHEREVVDLELYVPPSFPEVTHRDQVRIRGEVFAAVGSIERLDGNPFIWNPGGVVNLRKVVG